MTVARVEFYVDGNLLAQDTTSPYSINWDTTTVANGTHTIMARAVDAAGNTKETSVTVTISNGGGGADTTPPTVSITSPTNNGTVSGTTPINANASDNVGMNKVEFFIDGVLIGTDTTPD